MNRQPRLIIAFDPGSVSCGHAEIEPQGQDRFKVLGLGVIEVKGRIHFRLGWLYEELEKMLNPYRGRAADVVIEKHFVGPGSFGTITLAESRGVILAAVARAGFQSVFEYAPNTAKKAVTGSGRADKWAVALAVKRHLDLTGWSCTGDMTKPMAGLSTDFPLDATDAAALALCHAFRHPQAREARG